MRNESEGMDAQQRLLKVDELATRLRLDRKAVYEAIHRGDIPGVVRIGKVFRISADAVDAWLKLETCVA